MIKFNISIPENIINLWVNTEKSIKKSLYNATDLVRNAAFRKAPIQTGTLRRSLTTLVKRNTWIVGTNLKYAPIHEFGWIIRPKRKKFLVFKYKGRRVRTKRVKMPKRPYLKPALQDNIMKIQKIFINNFNKLLN